MGLVFGCHGGPEALSNEVSILILDLADGKAGTRNGDVAGLSFLKNL